MNNVCGCAYLAQRATYNKTNKGKRLGGCFLVMYGNWGSSAENVLLSRLSCVNSPLRRDFLFLILQMRGSLLQILQMRNSLLQIRSLLLLLWGQCIRDALSLEVLSWLVQLLLLLQIQPREWCRLQCLLCARGLF